LRTRPGQLHVDPNASISTAAGGTTDVKWLSTEVSLCKANLGARNVEIADVDSDPQNAFDGLLGLATMGFPKVSLRLRKRAVRMGVRTSQFVRFRDPIVAGLLAIDAEEGISILFTNNSGIDAFSPE
jgi:hypothetical protein